MMRSYWDMVGPESNMIVVLLRKGRSSDTQREDSHAKTESETGVMH